MSSNPLQEKGAYVCYKLRIVKCKKSSIVMEEKQGMPIIMLKELVLIEVVRLRAYDGSYIVPHEDGQNVTLLKLRDPHSAVPRIAEWKVIWTGESEICSFVSAFNGKVLTIKFTFYILGKIKLQLKPWPMFHGARDWKVTIKNASRDGKSFLAKLRPARLLTAVPCSLELGSVYGLTLWPPTYYYTLVPSPGWTFEVVQSSRVTKVNNNPQPMFPVVHFLNQGTFISKPNHVGWR